MTIREMTMDDLERVLEINEANVPEVGPVDMERMRFIVSESRIALVVEGDGEDSVEDDGGDSVEDGAEDGAEDGGAARDEIVGFCLVLAPGSAYDSVNYRWFMDHYGDAHYLDRVAFDASAQGKGLGSALYAEVDRRLAEVGADLTLEVNVDPPNEPSLAFHRKHGFVEVGRQLSKGIEVALMHKPAK